MAYLNGKEILFSPKIHIDPATEEKLQAAREEGYQDGLTEGREIGFVDGREQGIEEGRQAGWDEFWDMFQNGGERNSYGSAFARWGAEYIRPKYKIVPTDANSASATFENCVNLKKVEAQYFDFSQKAEGTSNNAGCYYTFNGCSNLAEIEDIGLVPQRNYYSAFANCYQLKTIAKMGVSENTIFNANTFKSCNSLENLTVDGTIGQNNFNLKDSTKLSKASITSVINALSENREHLETIGNPVVTLSKTAVQNAFTIKDDVLSLPYSNYGTGLDGITVTDNGDGSLTVNGTTNTGGGFYYLKQQSEFELPKGTYKVELDGDTTNSIIFALECDNSSFQNNGDWLYINGENARAFLVFETGVNYNNVTIRPKILCDEWDSLTHIKNLYWTISLV